MCARDETKLSATQFASKTSQRNEYTTTKEDAEKFSANQKKKKKNRNCEIIVLGSDQTQTVLRCFVRPFLRFSPRLMGFRGKDGR